MLGGHVSRRRAQRRVRPKRSYERVLYMSEYAWSSWDGPDSALTEIDRLVCALNGPLRRRSLQLRRVGRTK